MALAVPGPAELIITLNYDGSALEWADLWDNSVLCWIVDETGATPPDPRILGSFPPAPAATDPVISPPWAAFGHNGIVYIPDIWRGRLDEFFTWLATNNGAQRKLIGKGLASQYVRGPFEVWKTNHPDLALDDYPDPAPNEAEARRRGQLA